VGRLRRLRSIAPLRGLGRHIAYDFSEALMEDLSCAQDKEKCSNMEAIYNAQRFKRVQVSKSPIP
jgi:hypothetical protein